jgi:hypothetical protein
MWRVSYSRVPARVPGSPLGPVTPEENDGTPPIPPAHPGLLTRRRFGGALTGATLAGLALVACGRAGAAPTATAEPGVALTPTPNSYVGRLAGGDIFVAVAPDGERVRAYVCDGGEDGAATVARWFAGPLGADGRDRLTAALPAGGHQPRPRRHRRHRRR